MVFLFRGAAAFGNQSCLGCFCLLEMGLGQVKNVALDFSWKPDACFGTISVWPTSDIPRHCHFAVILL